MTKRASAVLVLLAVLLLAVFILTSLPVFRSIVGLAQQDQQGQEYPPGYEDFLNEIRAQLGNEESEEATVAMIREYRSELLAAILAQALPETQRELEIIVRERLGSVLEELRSEEIVISRAREESLISAVVGEIMTEARLLIEQASTDIFDNQLDDMISGAASLLRSSLASDASMEDSVKQFYEAIVDNIRNLIREQVEGQIEAIASEVGTAHAARIVKEEVLARLGMAIAMAGRGGSISETVIEGAQSGVESTYVLIRPIIESFDVFGWIADLFTDTEILAVRRELQSAVEVGGQIRDGFVDLEQYLRSLREQVLANDDSQLCQRFAGVSNRLSAIRANFVVFRDTLIRARDLIADEDQRREIDSRITQIQAAIDLLARQIEINDDFATTNNCSHFADTLPVLGRYEERTLPSYEERLLGYFAGRGPGGPRGLLVTSDANRSIRPEVIVNNATGEAPADSIILNSVLRGVDRRFGEEVWIATVIICRGGDPCEVRDWIFPLETPPTEEVLDRIGEARFLGFHTFSASNIIYPSGPQEEAPPSSPTSSAGSTWDEQRRRIMRVLVSRIIQGVIEESASPDTETVNQIRDQAETEIRERIQQEATSRGRPLTDEELDQIMGEIRPVLTFYINRVLDSEETDRIIIAAGEQLESAVQGGTALDDALLPFFQSFTDGIRTRITAQATSDINTIVATHFGALGKERALAMLDESIAGIENEYLSGADEIRLGALHAALEVPELSILFSDDGAELFGLFDGIAGIATEELTPTLQESHNHLRHLRLLIEANNNVSIFRGLESYAYIARFGGVCQMFIQTRSSLDEITSILENILEKLEDARSILSRRGRDEAVRLVGGSIERINNVINEINSKKDEVDRLLEECDDFEEALEVLRQQTRITATYLGRDGEGYRFRLIFNDGAGSLFRDVTVSQPTLFALGNAVESFGFDPNQLGAISLPELPQMEVPQTILPETPLVSPTVSPSPAPTLQPSQTPSPTPTATPR